MILSKGTKRDGLRSSLVNRDPIRRSVIENRKIEEEEKKKEEDEERKKQEEEEKKEESEESEPDPYEPIMPDYSFYGDGFREGKRSAKVLCILPIRLGIYLMAFTLICLTGFLLYDYITFPGDFDDSSRATKKVIQCLKILVMMLACFFYIVYFRFDTARTRHDLSKANILVFVWYALFIVSRRLRDPKV